MAISSPKTWLFAVLMLLAAVMCSALGAWQLSRAREKRLWLETLTQSKTHDLPPWPENAKDWLWQKVRFCGRYDPGAVIYLDNRIHNGQVGFEVATPLLRQGKALMVLRGWAPANGRIPPSVPVLQEEVCVEGVLVPWEDAHFRLGDQEEGNLWQYLDYSQAKKKFDYPLFSLVLKETSIEKENMIVPEGVPPPRITPAGHIAYAVQWFALAAIGFGFAVYALTRKA